jgi:hypothetical protein
MATGGIAASVKSIRRPPLPSRRVRAPKVALVVGHYLLLDVLGHLLLGLASGRTR